MATRTAASNSTSGSSGRNAAQPAGRPAPRAAKAPLLPPALRDFIKLRAVEGTGLVLASIGLLLILMLLTYERGDPSWNTAVNPEANPKIGNILGLPGAYIADLLMQWVGVASYLLGGIVMAWGLRIMSHRGLSRLPLRI
ncbi:MAG TPA: DNA translocase FtsK 4TM domain-containing protein, partial [Skermanella sp.]|nr:DNA translocase FtsK 4TM domain-containing protein [Skermanella sp.]